MNTIRKYMKGKFASEHQVYQPFLTELHVGLYVKSIIVKTKEKKM